MCLTTWYVPIKVVVTSVPGRLILQRAWLLLYLHCRFYTEVKKKKEICNSMCTCMCACVCVCACVCKHACVECACVCVNTWLHTWLSWQWTLPGLHRHPQESGYWSRSVWAVANGPSGNFILYMHVDASLGWVGIKPTVLSWIIELSQSVLLVV